MITSISSRRGFISNNPFIQGALDNFRMISDTEGPLRTRMSEDMKFRSGDQWPGQSKAERLQDGRPALVIDRIPQFIRQVVNQQRASRPGVQVDPVNSGASVDTAEALQGIIRAIERDSDADVAYSTACEHQVTMGRGYWRILTEYAEDDGFEQIIVIRRIPNPLSVYVDPTGTKADDSDARFAFIIEDVPKHLFRQKYGDAAMSDWMAFVASGSRAPEWMPEGRVRVAEYFYKEVTSEEMVILALPDAQTGQVRQLQFRAEDLPSAKEMPPSWKVIDRREIERVQVKWATITPVSILMGNDDKTAGQDFPSRYIPIVSLKGDELNLNGEIDLRGMVRDARDPQMMYNFWASAATEQIALAPRAPYIGYAGQFKGFEGKWNSANRKSYAYLEVQPMQIAGQPAPLPQRTQYNAQIESIVEMFRLADNDMKAVMGLYDASLGANGPEQSGKAILARQRQGEVGNSNYMDNLGRSVRYTGRILLDMIPRVYSPQRTVRILGADGKSKRVMVHAGMPPDDAEALQSSQGIAGIYDISVGRYDVSVSAGSQATRRQEAVSSMLELIKYYPQAAPVIADLVVMNMDWPGAEEIAARLRRTIPPGIVGNDQQADWSQQQQQQMEKLQQAYQSLQQQVQAKTSELQSKERIVKAQIASNEKIAMLGDRSKIIAADLLGSKGQDAVVLEAELGRLQSQLDHAHDFSMMLAEAAATPQAPPTPNSTGGAPAGVPTPGAQ